VFARSSRGLMDFVVAALCLWAAAWHTPAGALLRTIGARLTDSTSAARPLLAYYSSGLEAGATSAQVSGPAWAPPPAQGVSMGRGVITALSAAPPPARSHAMALAQRYRQPPPTTAGGALEVLSRAEAELGSAPAAVLAVFAGFDVAAFAVARARAEGRAPSLEALAARLPPSSPAVEAASSALMWGTAYGLAWPVPEGTRISSPFGWRRHPTTGAAQYHPGVDLAVAEGTPVKAVAAGVVRRASEDGLNGRMVVLDHGHGVLTIYCHNALLMVAAGSRVAAGQSIARSGNTGRSTGPHLHYQLELARRPTDPGLVREPGASVAPPLPL
jgi:murein DD-endopeptidase